MTTAAELHAAVWAALDALTTVTAYDGDVPTKPPADTSGRVYPYAVLWPSPGGSPAESAAAGNTGLDWTCQVTVAAGTTAWLLKAVDVVRAAVVGLVVSDGDGPITDETPRSMTVQRDEDVTPPRMFVPLLFGALTA